MCRVIGKSNLSNGKDLLVCPTNPPAGGEVGQRQSFKRWVEEGKLAKTKEKPRARCLGLLGTRLTWDAEQRIEIVNRPDYRTGEKAAGISSLFSCRIGRTPVWGGH
jgi:hypothetical protein